MHLHVSKFVVHVAMYQFRVVHGLTCACNCHPPDLESILCASLVQSMQEIAQVWMNTAGKVWCEVPLCRKHGAKTATDTLYCRDPNYVPPPGTRSILFPDVISNDWGNDATYMRDDDLKVLVKMVYGLFRGEIAIAPALFQANQAPFTSAETCECLGFSTMTTNATNFFKGDWWQWRKRDNIRSLLGSGPAAYAGLDRLTNNAEYSPYGKPETRQEAAGNKAMRPGDAVREGSADTQPDNWANDGPSLGECSNMRVVT